MTTSSGIVGINLHEPVHFEAPKLSDDNNQTSTNVLTEFMYQPTSRAIGEGLQLNQRSILSRRMDKFSIHKGIYVC
jgi:hypothetical protein